LSRKEKKKKVKGKWSLVKDKFLSIEMNMWDLVLVGLHLWTE
jgi:hypothetical protein